MSKMGDMFEILRGICSRSSPLQTQTEAQASSSSKVRTFPNKESVKIIQSSRRRNVKLGWRKRGKARNCGVMVNRVVLP